MAQRTLVYAHHELDLRLDIYERDATTRAPCVLFWHAGGLAAGNRRAFLPDWLKDAALARGWRFISADYRLVPPGDVRTLKADALAAVDRVRGLDEVATVIYAGSSAGALPAQLAAVAAPPAGLLLRYGLGTRLITKHWIEPYPWPPLDGHDLSALQPPQCYDLPPIVDSDVSADPAGRAFLFRDYMRQGIFVNVIMRRPGLAARLSKGDDVPADLVDAFPELHAARFPPTMIINGRADDITPVDDARALRDRLEAAAVPCELLEVPYGHAFDLGDAEWDSAPVLRWLDATVA